MGAGVRPEAATHAPHARGKEKPDLSGLTVTDGSSGELSFDG